MAVLHRARVSIHASRNLRYRGRRRRKAAEKSGHRERSKRRNMEPGTGNQEKQKAEHGTGNREPGKAKGGTWNREPGTRKSKRRNMEPGTRKSKRRNTEHGTGNPEKQKAEHGTRNPENRRAFPSPWDFRVPVFFYAFALPGSWFLVPPFRCSGFRFSLFWVT
jgi:hypothetical protein